MSMEILSIGICPICKQGQLLIEKVLLSKKLIICCDECEAEWTKPEDALLGINGSRDKFGKSVNADLSEVSQLGWEQYII